MKNFEDYLQQIRKQHPHEEPQVVLASACGQMLNDLAEQIEELKKPKPVKTLWEILKTRII